MRQKIMAIICEGYGLLILKRRLLETGKTQKEIAELLNITPQSINAILSASDVRSSTIEKLAKVLRLPVSFFYEGSELDKEQKAAEEAKAQAALINLSDFWEQTYSRNRLHKKASSNKKEDGLYAKWLLPELGNIPLCQITPEHLDKLKNEMLIQKKSPRTIQYVLAIFSQVWHLAETRGIVSGIAPTKKVKLPKFDNKRLRF